MQIQIHDKTFRLRPDSGEEMVIELPGTGEGCLIVGTLGLGGLTVLLPEIYTYAAKLNSRSFAILNDPLHPVSIELDVGGGEMLKLRRLEYLELDNEEER